MNKLLGKLVNNTKLSGGFTYTGLALISIGTLLTFFGSYYGGIKKGVDLMEDIYGNDEEEYEN